MLLAKRAVMHKNMQRNEVDEFLKNKGDYVKIDHLSKLVKEPLSLDLKKYVANILGDIYEKKGMTLDAARMFNISAMNSGTALERIKYFKKEAVCYIKTGTFEKADDALARAFSEADPREKNNIKNEILVIYKNLSDENIKKNRLANAIKVLEKIESMEISENEKQEVNTRLLKLYNRLGKIDKFFKLKGKMEGKKLEPERSRENRKTF